MPIPSSNTNSSRTRPASALCRMPAAILTAAVAACFATGSVQAATMQPVDPGWQPAPAQIEQAGPGWAPNANADRTVEEAYARFPSVEQGGPGWHASAASPARQGGPGWQAPDVRVDESTQVHSQAATGVETRNNTAGPDQSAVAANILFPPYNAALSGDATATLSGVANAVGNLPGPVVITARVDPIERDDAAGLAVARARSVADYLALAGVDEQRIVLQAVGTTQPLIDPGVCRSVTGADLAACLAPDRSVTVHVGRLDVGMADVD
jgi:outer membrane protein OmpA-like peptidoglycan-associated protein